MRARYGGKPSDSDKKRIKENIQSIIGENVTIDTVNITNIYIDGKANKIASDLTPQLSDLTRTEHQKAILERRGIYEEDSLFYFPSALFYFLYPISLLLLKNLWINSLEKISFILLPLFYLALIIILRRLFIWHRKTFFVS